MSALRRISRDYFKKENGSALLETAIVVPVLLLLAIGAAEYGRVYWTSIKVANAATAGAQYGAQGLGTGDPTLIEQYARDDAGDQSLTVTSSQTCRCPGSETPVACSGTCAGYGTPQFFVAVTASKNVAFLLRYPGVPQTISVSRTATFRVQ